MQGPSSFIKRRFIMSKENVCLVEVGKKEFSKLVQRNGGFGENKDLTISLVRDEATLRTEKEKEVIRYVYKK
jgi:hypothetical protein